MIKKSFAFFLPAAFLLSTVSFAQTTSSSPYSQFGVGDLQRSASVQSRAMGGAAYAISDTRRINFSNPASFAAVSLTTFDIAAYTNFVQLRNTTTSQVNLNSSLGNFALAFPVVKKWSWGAAFGLVPYSNVGYKVTTSARASQNGGTEQDIFNGNGGISQFFIGNGIKIHKNIYVGVNASYLFGNIRQLRAKEFSDTIPTINTRVANASYIGDFYFNYGIQYKKQLANERVFSIGYTGALETKINATRNILAERYAKNAFGSEYVRDTIENSPDQKGSLRLPNYNGIGFALEQSNKWMVAADVYMQQWSQFRVFGANPGLQDSYGFALGGQLTPDYNAVTNYFKKVEYRLGLNYSRSFLNVNNTKINQAGLTFGFGFPLAKAVSKINLSVELGRRGATENNLVQEDYMQIHLGFTINDKWFMRYRFD